MKGVGSHQENFLLWCVATTHCLTLWNHSGMEQRFAQLRLCDATYNWADMLALCKGVRRMMSVVALKIHTVKMVDYSVINWREMWWHNPCAKRFYSLEHIFRQLLFRDYRQLLDLSPLFDPVQNGVLCTTAYGLAWVLWWRINRSRSCGQ